MTLPFDIARCAGTTAPICEFCRRKEPGRPEWQAVIAPACVWNSCPNHIPHDPARAMTEAAGS